MELCKFINSKTIIVQDNPIFLPEGIVISNPTEEMLRGLGFKELIRTDTPKAPYGKKMVPNYYESGEVIRQIWIEEDISVQKSDVE